MHGLYTVEFIIISVGVWLASHVAWTPARMLFIPVPTASASWVFTSLNNVLRYKAQARNIQ